MAKVHALDESSFARPEGDCYAPQVFISTEAYNGSVIELNTESLSITGEDIQRAMKELGDDDLLARWVRIVADCDALIVQSRGFSQGDHGIVVVTAPAEWLELTGAPGITREDANDLSAWVWGDVYQVWDDEDDEDESYIVYGMDEASKLGNIKFPQYRTTMYYED